jgi:uncharacterized membrane protein
MSIIILAVFYVFTPLLILHLCHRFPFVNKLGAVIIAYLVGLIIGNIGLLPGMGTYLNEFITINPKATSADIKALLGEGLISENELLAFNIYKLRDLLMSITILLAIPLMLFSANIKQWGQMAGKTLTSMLIGLFSVVLVIVTCFFIFQERECLTYGKFPDCSSVSTQVERQTLLH